MQPHHLVYLVRLGAEAGQALFGNVDLQWLQRLNQHVEADVELELVDEQGPLDVLLDHHLLGLRARCQPQLTGLADEVDAVALGAAVRLHDEGEVGHTAALLRHTGLERGKKQER